jgi:L-malate glycosyltransferase
MKILFYSPVRLQNGGGCERWHCDIANSFKNQFKDQVEIVTANLGDDKWSCSYLTSQLQGIPYTKINFPIILGTLIPEPRTILKLYNKFKNTDVIHFIYGFAGQEIMMWILKIVTHKYFLVGHHAPTFHSAKYHNLYMKYISRYFLNKFDAHQTLNSSDKYFLENNWKIRNVNFIPSGICIERFLNNKRKTHSNLRFLSIGRFESQKGYDLLLKAIEKLNNIYKNNKMEFIFVGGGAMENIINKFARKFKNITNLGYVSYENIPQIYTNSDIYLLPSREEPFGLVLIEAWASGIPVLATKTEGPNDMVNPNKNGWFIPEISENSIYESIKSLYLKWLNQPKTFQLMQKDCINSSKNYSIDTTAKKMRGVLKNICLR